MSEESWYYCDADLGNRVGPVSIERLAELIRTEQLPYDVLVSATGAPEQWEAADTILRVLERFRSTESDSCETTSPTAILRRASRIGTGRATACSACWNEFRSSPGP